MSSTSVIRYRTKPEAAEENARLVAAVYAALADTDPGHLRYITYRLADGVTFVHIAQRDANANPLADLPEFAEFQRNLAGRCVELPQPSDATIVGSYRADL
jgi:hypothetical protein